MYGEIAAILVLNTAISGADLTHVIGYLRAKYGL
jgi:hypothetical protein